MEKMSLVSVIFVSYPEQLLLAITVILMVARFDLIKPKVWNVLKLGVVTVINTAFVVWLRAISPFFVLNATIYVMFILLVYVVVLRIRWYEVIVATLISITEFYLIELIAGMILVYSRLDINYILQNSLLRIACTLPVRAIEVFTIVLIYKVPVVIIDLKPIKYTVDFIKRFLLLSTSLLSGLILIANIFKIAFFSPHQIMSVELVEHLFINIIFAIAMILVSISSYIKYRKEVNKQVSEYINAISYIESLLDNGSDGIIKAKDVIKNEKSRWGRIKNEK